MKKSLFVSLFVLLPFLLFSEAYKITNAEYDIKGAGFKFMGKTREYPLNQNFPLDKKTTFENHEAFDTYIENYTETLVSSRYFDEVSVTYEALPSETPGLLNVTVLIKLQDSHHLIVMPIPKYSSNSGISLKFKGKDSNFLGSLNTMNVDMNLRYDDGIFKPGFNFNFDLPFSMGSFDAVFVNDYTIDYRIDDDSSKTGFEFDTKTGLSLSIPFNRVSLSLGLYQYVHRNLDYKYEDEENDDDIYLSEQFNIGLPVTIANLSNFTSITYSPSVNVSFNWDFDGINKEKDKSKELLGPDISFSHSISNGKVNWNDNLRKGYDLSLGNSYSYNFESKEFVPQVSFEGKFFWNYQANDEEIWNHFGINSRLYAFHYFDIPTNNSEHNYAVGERLRGILDDDIYSPTGIILNLDLPHSVFTAYFPTPILNFNFQFSPFFDMAVVFDSNNNRPSYNKTYYCGGFEFLVYPLKWSSFTVRASLGVDLSKNIFVEGLKNNKEIFIGLGIEY